MGNFGSQDVVIQNKENAVAYYDLKGIDLPEYRCKVHHVDGSMNAKVRKDELEILVSAALAAQQSEQATRTAPVAARRASKKEDE